MASKKYRKKPVVIEAIKLTKENIKEVLEFLPCKEMLTITQDFDHGLYVPTLEGVCITRYGEYIIKGTKGEFCPCKPDIFKDVYEEENAD